MDTQAFRKELTELINRNSIENGSDTPDFILSDYLMNALAAYESAVNKRSKWYGHTTLTKGGSRPLEIGTDAGLPDVECIAPVCGCDSSTGCCRS